MTQHDPRDPDYADRVRRSFDRQGAMRLMGAELHRVEPGEVEIAVPFRPEVSQQHGLFHGGVVAAVLDSACGYAALSLMAPGAAVLSAEFKIHFLAPARPGLLLARGRVVKPGRTLLVCLGRAYVRDGTGADGAGETEVALMTATMAAVAGRAGLED